MKIVDPEYRSPAMEAFGYKQLLFEPFVGGGLVTAMSVPLVANYGPWPFCIFATLLTIFWIALGIMVFGRGPQAVAVADSGPAE
jgi:ESS family glutamate:Na+ symporter